MNEETLQHTTLHHASQQNIPTEKPQGFTLTVIRGSDADYGAIYPFDPRTVVIGRSNHVDLRLNDHSISKSHCHIKHAEGPGTRPYVIEDLNSTNGTRLNGILIKSPLALSSGDRIEMGDTILRFNTQDDPDSEYQSHLLKLATTDPLTNLLNKATLQKELERQLNYSQRYSRPLSLLMIDIDHFKNVNDNFGHLTGDQILSQVGKRLQQNLRQQDLAGRFGGEEFTIILPETLLSGALILAERIRESISSQPFLINKITHWITISIGVAECNNQRMTSSELLEQADLALYQAKNNGRNQTIGQAPGT